MTLSLSHDEYQNLVPISTHDNYTWMPSKQTIQYVCRNGTNFTIHRVRRYAKVYLVIVKGFDLMFNNITLLNKEIETIEKYINEGVHSLSEHKENTYAKNKQNK